MPHHRPVSPTPSYRASPRRSMSSLRAVWTGVDTGTVQDMMGLSTITMTMRYAHLCAAHLRTAVNRASLGALASKIPSGTGGKTGSKESQRLEQGPVRITEPSEISIGMVGGAGRVRTAASQFCRLLP